MTDGNTSRTAARDGTRVKTNRLTGLSFVYASALFFVQSVLRHGLRITMNSLWLLTTGALFAVVGAYIVARSTADDWSTQINRLNVFILVLCLVLTAITVVGA